MDKANSRRRAVEIRDVTLEAQRARLALADAERFARRFHLELDQRCGGGIGNARHSVCPTDGYDVAFNRRHRPNRFVGQLEPSKRSNPAGDVVWLGRRRVEAIAAAPLSPDGQVRRSDEHTSELQSLMRT